jgi:WD40 repeat protein
LKPLLGHKSWIASLAFCGRDRLVSASDDKTAKIWDVSSSKELSTLEHLSPLTSVAWSHDGRWIAIGGSDNVVHIWDPANSKESHSLTGHLGFVTALAFDPSGQRLASASIDQTTRIWDLSHWMPGMVLRAHTDAIFSISFDPSGRRLASGSKDGTVKIFDADLAQEYMPFKGDAFYVSKVSFSPDGKCLASVGPDRKAISIWDISTCQVISTLHERTAIVRALAYSSDGKFLASASDNWVERRIPAKVKISDVRTGAVLSTFRASRGQVNAIAFSSDCGCLAWGDAEGELKFYDLRGRAEPRAVHPNLSNIEEIAAAPGSPVLAIRGRNSNSSQIQIWDFATWQNLRTLVEQPRRFTALVLSPNGHWLAAADSDHTIRLWDTASWEERAQFRGHSKQVLALAFSPNSTRLASGSEDQSIKIWDLESHQDVLTLQGNTGIATLAFSPDGLRLASAGNDKVIQVWDAAPMDQSQREHREALSLVKFLCGKPRSKEEIQSRIQADQTISDAVRRRALAMAGPYWDNLIRNQADASVTLKINAFWPKEDILKKIRTDPSLSEPVRQKALVLVAEYQEDPEDMNWASRQTVSQPKRDAAAYEMALRQAMRACQLVPTKASYLTTLGMAQYRSARYVDALKTLEQADKLNSAGKGYSIPADLAFLAMTQHQLGKKEAAKKAFDRLREIVKSPEWANNSEAQTFLREAQSLFETAGTGSEK